MSWGLAIRPKEEGKGRTFRSTLLAVMQADRLWFGGSSNTKNLRPVWALLGGSDAEMRPFVANLRLGHVADVTELHRPLGLEKNGGVEFLRSGGYVSLLQRHPEGTVATIYLPELFRLDPGMVDPEMLNFVLLLPRAQLAGFAWDREAGRAHIRAWKAFEGSSKDLDRVLDLAPAFGAYLDRRTACPLVLDARFSLQMLVACLQDGLASLAQPEKRYFRDAPWGQRGGLYAAGAEDWGFAPPLAFRATQAQFEEVLARETQRFFEITGDLHG